MLELSRACASFYAAKRCALTCECCLDLFFFDTNKINMVSLS